ncbi:MAG: KTSC domain-containing protein [Candidatus Omnitrophota bacterium]|nr:MAG: KTSC domain-containing protein [Candidatus Omnitrophota bacterium]
MDMISVNSSTLASIGYDSDSAILQIEFKDGSLYEYFNVPQHIYDALCSANSKGSYASRNIYKVYRQNRIC